MLGKGRTEHSSVFRSSSRSNATHSIGELKKQKNLLSLDENLTEMTKVTIGWICNQIMINIDQSNLKPTQASLKYPSSFILPDQFLKGTYLRSEVISEDASHTIFLQ